MDQKYERILIFRCRRKPECPEKTYHVQHVSSNVSKCTGVIRRVKDYLPGDTVNLLAKAMVFPHFNYCSPLWSNLTAHHHNSLQILHNKLARMLLHADIRTPISKMLEKLKWITLNDTWKHRLLLVAFKCHRQMVPVYMPSFTFIHSTHAVSTRSHTSDTLVIPPWNIRWVRGHLNIELLPSGTDSQLISVLPE